MLIPLSHPSILKILLFRKSSCSFSRSVGSFNNFISAYVNFLGAIGGVKLFCGFI